MNYNRRSAERRKIHPDHNSPEEYNHLLKWVWALIAIAFVLALVR